MAHARRNINGSGCVHDPLQQGFSFAWRNICSFTCPYAGARRLPFLQYLDAECCKWIRTRQSESDKVVGRCLYMCCEEASTVRQRISESSNPNFGKAKIRLLDISRDIMYNGLVTLSVCTTGPKGVKTTNKRINLSSNDRAFPSY